MKAPRRQSEIATPHTPQAMLIPDQGTTPTRRRTDSRAQVGDFEFFPVDKSDSPSRAMRVICSARGNMRDRDGAKGTHKRVAKIEPSVVNAERSNVARTG